MSIQGLRDFFSTLRASSTEASAQPNRTLQDEGPDSYEPRGHATGHRARKRWLERHRNALEWVGDGGVLNTCAELGGNPDSTLPKRSRPAA